MKNLINTHGDVIWGWILPVLGGIAVVALCHFSEFESVCRHIASAAVVLAGFTVAAFNLRFRTIDALQKFVTKRSQVEHLSKLFADCRVRIDGCLKFFVATTIVMVASPLVNALDLTTQRVLVPFIGTRDIDFGIFFAFVPAFMFGRSMYLFVQILGSFRVLEDFSLEMLSKNAETL